MTAKTEEVELSAECEVAKRPGYEDLHAQCRQTKDIPLPHGGGILLQRRCGCWCHLPMPLRPPHLRRPAYVKRAPDGDFVDE